MTSIKAGIHSSKTSRDDKTASELRTGKLRVRPDQLEDVVDEAGAVVAGQRRVVVLQQSNDGVPALACIVDHVVAAHVHVELHPVHLFRQVQDICMTNDADVGREGELVELKSVPCGCLWAEPSPVFVLRRKRWTVFDALVT